MAMKPPLLEAGDTVGIVTLGSPINPSVANARIETLQSMGLHVVLGDSVYGHDGFLAGSNEERARDFMRMIIDDDIDMILPSRGGVGVAGILPYLDYPTIQDNPKVITGYSDITVLLNALYQFSNLVTFQSLMLIDFRFSTPAFNFDQFFKNVSTLEAPRLIENPPGIPLVGQVPGNVTAPIVGGNLTSFIGTLGTPFEIDTRGKILLLEETNEPVNTVYRYLNQLHMAGKFDDCAGIVMGECSGCSMAYGVSYEELIDDFLVPLGKPLITGLSTAHGLFKTTVPIGSQVQLNASEAQLVILEPTVMY
ncbi:S66 peptidase family protein [Alteribacillus iranensis]|uniref:Muramoyltetrapeptide carboxypeptidase n=1 Tax=Alteribacillus iranensis TaxID=930128 RepID=A0A1I2E185_9BACI|nr:LD-carboxypeptidase [Alteribacillus iranensis]SFE86301.1 muramoyltetrapeptide carboxypeptidase [Alteribacillus iranensis]